MAARTESGSQAGDPLGDIFFMAAHTRASRLVRDRLREEGLLMELPYDENTPFWMPADKPTTTVSASDGAYLDDALYFQRWESAPKAMLAAKKTMTIIFDTLTSCGLNVNMEKGKTEVIFDFRGPGAKHCRREVATEGGIEFGTMLHGKQKLNRVVIYKHMGSSTRPGTRMNSELARKGRGSSEHLDANGKGALGEQENRARSEAIVYYFTVSLQVVIQCGHMATIK